MNFLPNTDKDREEMLKVIGVSSVEELFGDIPPELRFKGDLKLPPALSEFELARHMEEACGQEHGPGLRELYRGRGLRSLHPCRGGPRIG